MPERSVEYFFNMKITVLFVIISYQTLSNAQPCIPRRFGEESFVCVCNSTYCDSADVDLPEKGHFRNWISRRDMGRLEIEEGIFESNTNNAMQFKLNVTKSYQKILGFGGAFTDSSGLNIKYLSEKTQDQLIKAYFGSTGNRYNLARVPIGGVDFSTRGYTLDDVPNDKTLSNFSLAQEDINYKIPYMKRALQLNGDLRFVAAAWTAPKWMKTNKKYVGFLGLLEKQYYQVYANYLIKFLESYDKNGLSIWAISTGNEPQNVFIPFIPINDMGWTPRTLTKWVIEHFGPTLKASIFNQTLILALDDDRNILPWAINFMYDADKNIEKYIDGIAFHWYTDKVIPVSVLDTLHRKYPDKFLLMTEACTGSVPWTKPVKLGSWARGEAYMHDIIENMNHWVTGWIDWNLALNKSGGPNWVHNEVDSSIIVNPETDEFFKQPMYYALAHFSKFISRDSIRIDLTGDKDIESIAFLTPDSTIVIVLSNPTNDNYSLTILDPEKGNINVKMESHSFRTIVYRK